MSRLGFTTLILASLLTCVNGCGTGIDTGTPTLTVTDGLTLWYRATSLVKSLTFGSPVATLYPENNYGGFLGASGNPTYNLYSGYPQFSFISLTGSDQLSGSSSSGANFSQFHAFFVADVQSNGELYGMIQGAGSYPTVCSAAGSQFFSLRKVSSFYEACVSDGTQFTPVQLSSSVTGYQLHEVKYESNGSLAYEIRGQTSNQSSTNGIGTLNLTGSVDIGTLSTGPATFTFLELVVFNRTLDDSDAEAVRYYLKARANLDFPID